MKLSSLTQLQISVLHAVEALDVATEAQLERAGGFESDRYLLAAERLWLDGWLSKRRMSTEGRAHFEFKLTSEALRLLSE